MRRCVGSGWTKLVITDVRMDNEAEVVRALGGRLVRVHRVGAALAAPDTSAHASEQHVGIDVDAELVNDGSLEALATSAEHLVTRLFGDAVLVRPITTEGACQ